MDRKTIPTRTNTYYFRLARTIESTETISLFYRVGEDLIMLLSDTIEFYFSVDNTKYLFTRILEDMQLLMRLNFMWGFFTMTTNDD